MIRYVNKGIQTILVAVLLVLAQSFAAWALGLSTHGTMPDVDIDCSSPLTAPQLLLESHSFGATTSQYSIIGSCITWVTQDGNKTMILGPRFRVKGAWDSQSLQATEKITIDPFQEYNDFTKKIETISKTVINTTAICQHDPWVNDSPGCSGSSANAGAGTPQDALAFFTAKHGKDYPASRFLLASAFKIALRDELKKMAPVISSPTPGQAVVGNVSFEATVNPKTKTFLKEKPNWDIEAEFLEVSPSGGHQVWTADLVNGTAKKSIHLPAHKYQVHARARGPQFNAGNYSTKISFEVSGLAQDCASLSPPASIPDSKAGATISAAVYFTNCGTRPWAAATSGNAIGPVNLSYHWYDAAGVNKVIQDGLRTPLIMQPGQTGNVNAQIQMPPTPGTYTLKWDVVYENNFWFSQPPALLKYGGFGNMSPKVKVK